MGFAVSPGGAYSPPEADSATLEQRVNELGREVQELQQLVRQLHDQLAKAQTPQVTADRTSTVTQTSPPETPSSAAGSQATGVAKATSDVFRGFTVNALLDGYYEYNFNSPVGRANDLRAYDVSSNSFSLNQAALIIESAPDLTVDKRFGMRIDLQYGQATSTLQGNAANELRPHVYRNVYQAYGTYIFPVAGGLTVDFGKWGSSLGIEGNYTKDQLNYSRSYWYDYLPFYHMGIRSKLAVNSQLALNFWVTNGANQAEDFNSKKDFLLGLVLTPLSTVSWTLNYYQGQEHPDVTYLQSLPTGPPNLPAQQGSYVQPIVNAPDGGTKIVDTYVSWQVTDALLLVGEADYVQQRLYSYSSPDRVQGGALYAGYQFSPNFAIAARGEYLEDHGGLFSGTTQYLKEETLTFDYRPQPGFLMRAEFRRDQSNEHYFLGHTLDSPANSQPTLTLGLVWWLGQKEGFW